MSLNPVAIDNAIETSRPQPNCSLLLMMTASRTQFMNYLSLCFLPNKCFVPHPRTTASGGRVFQVPAAAGWCLETTNSDQLIRDGCCSTQKSIRNGFQIERQEKVLLKWGGSAATSTHQSNPLPVLGLGGGRLFVSLLGFIQPRAL